MLPPNVAPWRMEFLRLKESEEWPVQEGVSDLPRKQVIKGRKDFPTHL